MFDDLTGDELVEAAAAAAAAGLDAARLTAAVRLAQGPASGAGCPAALAKILMERDQTSTQWERLGPFEQRWSLLVLRIIASVMDPVGAVADARRRGLSWASIGGAMGITAQTAHGRFATRIAQGMK